ncbi:uncharacterized protein BP01DRAFT_394701, partial [Aspergillus saccharolyticus JOP 1030-1]
FQPCRSRGFQPCRSRGFQPCRSRGFQPCHSCRHFDTRAAQGRLTGRAFGLEPHRCCFQDAAHGRSPRCCHGPDGPSVDESFISSNRRIQPLIVPFDPKKKTHSIKTIVAWSLVWNFCCTVGFSYVTRNTAF